MFDRITLVFLDEFGEYGRCSLKNSARTSAAEMDSITMDDVDDFAQEIAKWSAARLISASRSTTILYDVNDDSNEGGLEDYYEGIKQKCELNYIDADDGSRVSIRIPAPLNKCFDDHQEATADIAGEVALAIASSTNREEGDLMYRGGGLISKLPKLRKRTRDTGQFQA